MPTCTKRISKFVTTLRRNEHCLLFMNIVEITYSRYSNRWLGGKMVDLLWRGEVVCLIAGVRYCYMVPLCQLFETYASTLWHYVSVSFFLKYTYFTLPCRGLGLVRFALYLVD